jgi:CHAT domain-containing protein
MSTVASNNRVAAEPTNRTAALAEYFVLADRILVMVLRSTDERPQLVELESSPEDVRAFVSESFAHAEGGDSIRSLASEDVQSALGPLVSPLDELVSEEEILWLVPHDVLHYVPLHALELAGRPLIDRNPVCYTPSAAVMKYCRANRREARGRAVVLADSLGDLVHARDEGNVVGELFGVRPAVQREATKEFLLGELEQGGAELDLLHVSCHGYFAGDAPLDSAILLAPPPDRADDEDWVALTAAEIFGLDLGTRLVTLSACESGVVERRAGDELVGLTRALTFAGSPSSIVSLWSVDELSTALLMERFYAELEAAGKVEALRRAQRAVRDLTAEEVLAHCDRRLDALDEEADPELYFELRRDRAKAHVLGGDLEVAEAEFEALQEYVAPASPVHAEIEDTLARIRIKRLAAPAVDYSGTPFAHFYYWAPFVLYGDWQ